MISVDDSNLNIGLNRLKLEELLKLSSSLISICVSYLNMLRTIVSSHSLVESSCGSSVIVRASHRCSRWRSSKVTSSERLSRHRSSRLVNRSGMRNRSIIVRIHVLLRVLRVDELHDFLRVLLSSGNMVSFDDMNQDLGFVLVFDSFTLPLLHYRLQFTGNLEEITNQVSYIGSSSEDELFDN